MNESDEQFQKVASMQILMTPNVAISVGIVWTCLSVSSFFGLLYFGGWACSILSVILPILGFPWIVPIGYGLHMRTVRNYIMQQKPKKILEFMQAGIPFPLVEEVLNEGIREKRNPQQWWGELKFRPTEKSTNNEESHMD